MSIRDEEHETLETNSFQISHGKVEHFCRRHAAKSLSWFLSWVALCHYSKGNWLGFKGLYKFPFDWITSHQTISIYMYVHNCFIHVFVLIIHKKTIHFVRKGHYSSLAFSDLLFFIFKFSSFLLILGLIVPVYIKETITKASLVHIKWFRGEKNSNHFNEWMKYEKCWENSALNSCLFSQ